MKSFSYLPDSFWSKILNFREARFNKLNQMDFYGKQKTSSISVLGTCHWYNCKDKKACCASIEVWTNSILQRRYD